MNDTIIQKGLEAANHVLTQPAETKQFINWWMWLAIAEFGLIVFLLYKRKKNQQARIIHKIKEESLNEEIDFNNIINSSFHSLSLYNELKVKCHPDRFPNDEEKNLLAQSLFQEITKNKTNLKRLRELKIEAQENLNIKF